MSRRNFIADWPTLLLAFAEAISQSAVPDE
jgi:hypothetical protein